VWKIKADGLTNLHSITWSTNGHLLALQDQNIYDVETGKLVSKLNHYIDGSGKVSWSPNGSHVYIFFDLGGGVMDAKTNKYEFSAGIFPRFAWSKSGQYFAAVEESSNEIYVWDTVNNKVVRQEKQGIVIYALTWTSNDELLALGIKDIRTMVWNTNTGEVMKTMFVPPNPLFYLFRYLPE
jgi:WD40 repeat protein